MSYTADLNQKVINFNRFVNWILVSEIFFRQFSCDDGRVDFF